MGKIRFTIPSEVWRELRPSIKKLFPGRQVVIGYLLSGSTKADKADGLEVLNRILYLAPHNVISTRWTLCSSSTKQCRKACVAWTGRLGMSTSFKAMAARTIFWRAFPQEFLEQLDFETERALRRANKRGWSLSIRLNGTSDIPWELPVARNYLQHAIKTFPTVKYYDYTKHAGRCFKGYRTTQGVEAYHLTFSWSGNNEAVISRIDPAINIAVPFYGKQPRQFLGRQVVSGDDHDLRWLDPAGSVIGLKYKLPKKRKGKGTVKPSELPDFVVQTGIE